MNKCFLDTNILVYLVDETSIFHGRVNQLMSEFEKNDTNLCVSHMVVAEFIHIFSNILRLAGEKNIYAGVINTIRRISLIPTISVISAPENFRFINSTITLMKTYQLRSNDAYILSMLQHYNLLCLFTFDQKMINVAKKLHIKIVS